MKNVLFMLVISAALISGSASAASPDEWEKFMEKNPQYAAFILYTHNQLLERHLEHIADLVAIGIIDDPVAPRICKECDLPRGPEGIEDHASCLMERIGCLTSK